MDGPMKLFDPALRQSSRWIAVAACAFTGLLHAQVGEPAFKLTAASHRFSESGNGLDINLRHTSEWGTKWIGYFDASGLDAHQLRGGWEHTFGDRVRLLPSLQLASGGFIGGSVNVETGKTWFVGAGYGRTNQRPYYNLNFDPNDAWSLAGGYRSPQGESYALSYVRDDRDNPDQQHVHAVYRTPVNGQDRLTVDLLYKQGLVNGDGISKLGLTVTYDWPRYFVRLAYDPNTNFTTDNVLRLSVGTRF
jgi:hypothetical protein